MPILWKPGHETETDYSAKDFRATKPSPTFAGAVLGTTGRDVRIMSDVWAWVTFATVWDGTKVTEVAVATADHGGSYADVVVDATPEVLAAVASWRAAEAAKAVAAEKAAAEARRFAEASRVARGKDVTVVKGRKVPKGTTGRVFWVGATKWGMRVGIEPASGERVFTALSNVAVTNPSAYLDKAA